MMKTKVLLVDNHQVLIDSLRLLIGSHPGLKVVGEANNGKDAIRLAKQLSPHVIVMDIKMPDINGIEATGTILDINPDVKVIALSVSDDIVYIRSMLGAGASGYLLKESSGDELVDAIVCVANGDKYVSKQINSVILEDYQQSLKKAGQSGITLLSARELEILKVLAKGLNTKQISAELKIASKTVDTHRRNIMDKLHIYTLPGLTKYAIRNKLITLEE